MLTTLLIENYAIVKKLELDLQEGMTAFTGETGAGKSIMIDALMLALGERADASVIRLGENQCSVSASFLIAPESEPVSWLEEHEVPFENQEVVLRRIISAEGRSKALINGQLFPLQKLKELGELLVHIHGQHQHQTLLQHTTHRIQLDDYAKHHALLSELQNLYKSHQKIQQALSQFQQSDKNQDKLDLLQFQIEELNALSAQEGEMEALHHEHQLLHHAKDYLVQLQTMQEIVQGEEGLSILRGLHQILQLTQSLPAEDNSVKAISELINNALIQCEEALDEMESFADRIQLDPNRLQEVETRLTQLHQAARKYHIDASHLPAHLSTLQEELEHLQNQDKHKAILEKELRELQVQFEEKALTLRTSRLKAAKKLADEITESIQQMGMPKGQVEIEITPLDKMHPHGMDKVEYKVCTNPGTLPDSLSKIASGGELSRISLAIQVITAQQGSTPTLLFDEVDVGIGGATAALVGRLLRQLGQRLQVFCVTHQPQVAAAAHHHFRVEKQMDNQQTFSVVVTLKEENKIEELARMLGGLKVTEQTRLHAKELLAEMQ